MTEQPDLYYYFVVHEHKFGSSTFLVYSTKHEQEFEEKDVYHLLEDFDPSTEHVHVHYLDFDQAENADEKPVERVPVYYVSLGKVTDPDAYPEGAAKLGDPEWRFGDGPTGMRSSSFDYLSLEEGLRALSPCEVIMED